MTKEFRRVKVPLGYLVTIVPLPLFVGPHLATDRMSWLWDVMNTNFAARATETRLWEAF